MALRELLVATIFVFTLGVYMLVAGPVVDGVADGTAQEPVGDKPVGLTGAKVDQVKNSALVLVPTLAGVGFVLFAYAAIARKESYRGRL